MNIDDLKKYVSTLNYDLNEKLVEPFLPRNYLGISSIGTNCMRKLQFDHYWAYKNVRRSKRMERLLNTGHYLEKMIKDQMVEMGFEIVPCDIEIVGAAGHWQGHEDAIMVHSRFRLLGEVKTHNTSNFNKLLKTKSVKVAFQSHYDQMTGYMGYKNLQYGLYIALDKNDSEMYVELIEFDENRFKELKQKQLDVIATDYLHKRIGNNSAAWWECKMCDALDACFGRIPIEKNYRTHKHTDVCDGGVWELNGVEIPREEQHLEPENFEYNPIFDSI